MASRRTTLNTLKQECFCAFGGFCVDRRGPVRVPHDKSTMNGMFGPAAAELEPGARNAVEVCLAIQPGEWVALIADQASAAVAASLARVLDQVGAPWDGVLIEQVASRPMTVAPAAVLDALEAADA